MGGDESAMDLIYQIALYMPVLLVSLTVHEFAHAWTAWRLKDDTAALQGRLTLDPRAHIDPIGTLLMPLLGILFPGAPILGWAKPVPITPVRFTRKISMKTGVLITSLAGPVSNLLLTLVALVALRITAHFWSLNELTTPGSALYPLGSIILAFISLNTILFIFNLLPVPPLDGSKILSGILPRRYEMILLSIEQHGFIILIMLLMVGGRFIGMLHSLVLRLLFGLFGF